MNYANMIEEKNLKKTFIIATLCSTLVGTFTSSIGLWDRVKDRQQQKKRDTKQDDKIAKLQAQIDDSEKRNKDKEDRIDRLSQRGGGGRDNDDVGFALERSGAAVSREFDEGYARLGRRFAVGDTITENRLQAQVIALQQTVINVLQDALYSGRQLDSYDMSKLIAASNAARDGSLDALRQQRQRQTSAIEGPPPQGFPSPRRASTVMDVEPLYCRYALDLQYVRNKPLAATFAPGGSCRCPECGVRLDVESDDFWEIDKRAPRLVGDGRYEREVIEEREFHLGQRFIVKCHTPDGEFACVICTRHRDRDAICPTVKSLVNHVGKYHDIGELEREFDFDQRSRTLPKALPAPSVGSNREKQRAIEYNPPVRQKDDFELDARSAGRSSYS
ncbi:hypothetical protein SCAR479_00162 [Seiridium cardinale]|uniref:Uncharacterized protein n=1 Tax=Seiridium cardinale TaxID=138064 RepID=A0ABR2Y8Q8_9PEZI